MDNQQRRETFFAWLAGFCDGDGCIATTERHLTDHSFSINYFIRWYTTSKAVTEYVHQMLDEYGIGHYINRESKQLGLGKIPPWRISVAGMQRCKKLLDELIPYLVIKKQEGLLMRQLINLREPINRKIPYGDAEHNLHLAIKELKRNRHLTDYSVSSTD